MLVIADSSPLRYLIVIGVHEVLPAIVRVVINNRPPWLCIGDPDSGAIATVSTDIDIGERAALALALLMKADLVVVDDAAGRRAAISLGIRITGIIGVLRVAAERGLIDVPAVLARLRTSGFYIHDTVIEAAFEPWL